MSDHYSTGPGPLDGSKKKEVVDVVDEVVVVDVVDEPIVTKRKKLNDKIRELNSTRVFKKITPKGDLSWYIKWTASIILLIGMVFTSAGGYEPLNLMISLVGVTGWLIVGMMWHDRALIFINGIAIFIYSTGIMKAFLPGIG